MIHTLQYRGYTLVYDDMAVDVWQDDEYVETTPTLDKAKADVDGWLQAK